MKTICLLCFKRVLPVLFLLFALSANLMADPQYYNYNTGTVDNSFPFGITTGKMIQILVAAGEFNTPTPAPNGNITSFSFAISNTYPIPNVTYTSFRILFLDTNLTALPTSLVTGNWDTVYFRASVVLNAAVSTWLNIVLDHPHAYNNTRSLLIQVEQCAGAGATGFPLKHTNTATNRRTFSTGGCPFTYGGTSLYVSNVGINVATGPNPCDVPELLYYRWENSTATTTPNTASAPVGTNPSPYTGTFGPGGMYDTCMVGTGATGTTGILPGWNCNLAATNWTIGFWVKDLGETVSGNPTYLFGDPGSTSFRCFYGGAALPNNILFRGPFTDITIACPMPGSYYFHFVYDGTNILIYRNGALLSTNPRAVNMPTGTGFRVAGYTGGAYGINTGGRMDEFRLYNRALSLADIAGSWDKSELPACLTGIEPTNNQIPIVFSLSQNYPNPFNPVTNIKFAIPSSGLVKLVIFDVLGREVKTLVNEVRNAGNYVVDFDASSLASGAYFYTLTSGNFTDTKKMVLVK